VDSINNIKNIPAFQNIFISLKVVALHDTLNIIIESKIISAFDFILLSYILVKSEGID
jgi:uncharacterized MnhB-related membrane protein